MWYREHIGGNRCPIVDTWWQTETGAIVISPLPGHHRDEARQRDDAAPRLLAPRCSTRRRTRSPSAAACSRSRKPWPSMLRTIWGDDERYVQTYFSKWPGRPDLYFPGDGAKRDEDGYFWILGRVDDVLNVAGHRIGTMEVEIALVEHPAVAEAAVVGKTHELKGQAHRGVRDAARRASSTTPRAARRAASVRRREDRRDRASRTTSCSRADLPKTRSGKIMRRLLRDIAEGRRWATRRRSRIRTWSRISQDSTRPHRRGESRRMTELITRRGWFCRTLVPYC